MSNLLGRCANFYLVNTLFTWHVPNQWTLWLADNPCDLLRAYVTSWWTEWPSDSDMARIVLNVPAGTVVAYSQRCGLLVRHVAVQQGMCPTGMACHIACSFLCFWPLLGHGCKSASRGPWTYSSMWRKVQMIYLHMFPHWNIQGIFLTQHHQCCDCIAFCIIDWPYCFIAGIDLI